MCTASAAVNRRGRETSRNQYGSDRSAGTCLCRRRWRLSDRCARHAIAPRHANLYQARIPIYPKMVHGTYRKVKWTLMAMMLAIYYVTPWIRWDRGPGAPSQAILVDIVHERLYFFFIEIWPQEVYYITGLLILSAVALFLVTALFGRLWCGYACPQTVWTDLFIWVETTLKAIAARASGSSPSPGARTKSSNAFPNTPSGSSSRSPPAAPGFSILPTRQLWRASSCMARRPWSLWRLSGYWPSRPIRLAG